MKRARWSLCIVCVSLFGCDSSSSERGDGPAAGSPAAANLADSDEPIGGFDVQLVAPVPSNGSSAASAGQTKVLGKVYNGQLPEAVVWEQEREEGGCRLLIPRVPFCDPACRSAVCVENDLCKVNPSTRNLGKVVAKGLRRETGASEFSLISVQNSYQTPGDVKLAYPPFDEGDPIRIEASGADIAAFSLEARGIAPLKLPESTGYALDASTPLMLSWTAPGVVDLSRIQIKLDISHHGGTKGKIECDVEDSGTLAIGSTLIGRLLELGVAGFPTIVITRRTVGTNRTPSGIIDLDVYMYQERAVEIPGLASCVRPEDCPGGQECRADLTCARM